MNPNNEAPFPKLRTAYLRAIARAWRDEAYLRKLADATSDPHGALPLLEQDFNFKFPFDVKLVIDVTKRPHWVPIGTTGWFGVADKFEIFLPGVPGQGEDSAGVLARYCAEFPSLLGQGVGAAQAPPDFASVGVTTSRVVALTWHSAHFAEELFGAEDARVIFQESMDCIVPWNFNLKFQRVPGPSSDTDEYWRKFPRSVITLHLPMPPDSADVRPIALASYNDTGGQYPFTCA